MSRTLKIELDEIVKLEADGKTFVFNPEAEDSLEKLLDLQESVENALQNIKAEIAKQGVEISDAFTGVRGSKIKASYRHYGQPYKLDTAEITSLDSKFYSKSISYRPNTKNIEEYLSGEGKLPKGVIENRREKQVSIKKI